MNNGTYPVRPKSIDHVALVKQLVVMFLVVAVVFSASFVIKTGNSMYMAAFVALPFALMLMHRPRLTLVGAILLNATNLPLPGNIASTQLGFLGFGVLTGTYVLGLLMGRPAWISDLGKTGRVLKFYVAWLIVLMAVHGSGLRVFGSATWGGTRYIAHFIAVMVVFVLSGMKVERRHLKWIIYGSVVAGMIGSFLLWRGYAVSAEESSSIGSASVVSKSRLSFLIPFFLSFFPFAFAVDLGRFKAFRAPLILLSLTLIGLTGFRSKLLGAIIVLIGFGFFKARNKVPYIALIMICGLLSWAGIVAISSSLPLGLQRAVSFVPGAIVDFDTAFDAANSIEWRVEIWVYCLERFHEYWLLGKGMAFNVWEVVENVSSGDIYSFSPWFAYQTHAYHSGPLALLVDLGIPGASIYLSFSVMAFRRFWKYARAMGQYDTVEHRFALFHCVNLLYHIFAFYFVYGDFNNMATLITWFAVYSVFVNSVVEIHKNDALEDGGSRDGEYPLDSEMSKRPLPHQ
jgi:hypothetical protein